MTTCTSIDLTSHSYVSRRLKLHYVDWGNADAPPLILLHGGRDHCRNWDWVAKELRDEYHIIAPDLRGHGDSQWSPDGNYALVDMIYDLAQLIHQQQLAPVNIVAHSLGGSIAMRYAGTFPENVAKLVSIEGMGFSPEIMARRENTPIGDRLREWIDKARSNSGRQPKRYTSIDEALKRMQEENSHLSPDQARHLTIHGISQNEDGSYSWKFDNFVWTNNPVDMQQAEVHALWSNITCPTLLVYGKESWASNPATDGRLQYLRNARVAEFENAGHWVHHDRLPDFVAEVRAFLAG